MQDDELTKKIRFGRLYDMYGGLLTEKQQAVMEQYFYDDLSLGEIAESCGISRANASSSASETWVIRRISTVITSDFRAKLIFFSQQLRRSPSPESAEPQFTQQS